MRESNFAFPAQNRACVCISSQLYDRRALDTTSPLPLLNSLTHLTYLTSTSPRIREILTCDGGLERLVRLLRDFCLSPPPPENPAAIYGLSPPNLPRPPSVPTLNPKSFDRYAAYRFSLAFQCVVNIGVRGSEPIRSRVVQAGTLEVVGCVLEAWLASKGFAVGPAANMSGLPRESREQRALRRQQQLEQRQREQAQELARLLALERTFTRVDMAIDEDENVVDVTQDQSVATPSEDTEASLSTDTSVSVTPLGSGTPTGAVTVSGRDRSGTVIARRVWDATPEHTQIRSRPITWNRTIRGGRTLLSTTPSTSTSRADTETEDDGEPDGEGDGDVEMGQDQDLMDENMPPPTHSHARRTVGIVADSPSPTGPSVAVDTSDSIDVVDLDSHIIINTNAVDGGMGGVEDGIVALEQNVNDDLALGAPPGAPGAIDGTPRTRANTLTIPLPRDGHGRASHHGTGHGREELTPRAILAALPAHTHAPTPVSMQMNSDTAVHGIGLPLGNPLDPNTRPRQTANIDGEGRTDPPRNVLGGRADNTTRTAHAHRHTHHHHHQSLGVGGASGGRTEEVGPFREEDVLLSLQLLAYLSKYPHVRQAFYKPRLSFHPATAQVQLQPSGSSVSAFVADEAASRSSFLSRYGVLGQANIGQTTSIDFPKKELNFLKTLTGRGKEKAPAIANIIAQPISNASPTRMTNVFSLVERFTFRPSPAEGSLPQPPPFLSPEIQYWAGVIMRNACRKDESRGGIRQCANMLCGKWESFPREFAKCRRCRKAKYCGKECQSRAWSEGHRFWCSARESDETAEVSTSQNVTNIDTEGNTTFDGSNQTGGGTTAYDSDTSRIDMIGETSSMQQDHIERRQMRDRDRQRFAGTPVAGSSRSGPIPRPTEGANVGRNNNPFIGLVMPTSEYTGAITSTDTEHAQTLVPRVSTSPIDNVAFFGSDTNASLQSASASTASTQEPATNIPISSRRRITNIPVTSSFSQSSNQSTSTIRESNRQPVVTRESQQNSREEQSRIQIDRDILRDQIQAMDVRDRRTSQLLTECETSDEEMILG